MVLENDVFGYAVFDWVAGSRTFEVLERDDGYSQIGAGPNVYLSKFRNWPQAERKAIRYLTGRVLDVGCGAGRVALDVQSRGIDVVGLEVSPLAIKAARLRGVKKILTLPFEDLDRRVAKFDSIVMFGNNFGLFENPDRARKALMKFCEHANPGTRIFAESTSGYFGGAPALDRTRYRQNLARGISPGQVRVRYHYKNLVGPWFRWLYVSQREMQSIVVGTGWRLERVLQGGLSDPYVAILIKD